MKNKKLTYILVPLVVLIWGLIIYKIINGLESDEAAEPVFGPMVFESSEEPIDTFVLNGNYRDPFLSGKVQIIKHSESTDVFSNRRSLSQASEMPVKADAQYFGIISNAKSKYKVGLIKVQGKDYLLKEGDLADKMKIYKLYKDSVIVMLQKYKYTINRI